VGLSDTQRVDARRRPRKPASLEALGVAGSIWLLGVAAFLFWLAFDGGTFDVQSRSSAAIAVWWAVGVGTAAGLLSPGRLRGAAAVVGGCLLGYAALASASMGWGPSAEAAYAELDRNLLYLGIFLLVVLLARRRHLDAWADGIALAISAIAVLALASRLFPGLVGGQGAFRFLPIAATRLNYPLGYWNGLAIFTSIGFPLVLRAALQRPHLAVRAGAVGLLPALGSVIYLASSRSGVIAAAVGTFVLFCAVERRAGVLGALSVGAVGTVATLFVLHRRNALVNGPVDGALARSEGHEAAVLIAAICVSTGLAYVLLVLSTRRLAPSRAFQRALLGASLIGVVAAFVAIHPVRQFARFRQPLAPTSSSTNYVSAHLLSSAGNGRWQYWTVAAREFRAHPLVGGGAGSYETWWNRLRPGPLVARDAHSLYIETAGELGLFGLLLIGGVVGTGLTAGARQLRRGPSEERTTVAALAAAFLAFAVAAGVDWMWELSAVGAVGIVLLALLALPSDVRAEVGRRRRSAGVVSIALLAAAAVAAEGVLLLSDERVRESQAAVVGGDLRTAARDAAAARALEPWAATPSLQLALIRELAGDIPSADAAIHSAIARAPQDWTLWLVAARIETKERKIVEARRSLARARHLNPLGPIPGAT
jgi:hypothetical protein